MGVLIGDKVTVVSSAAKALWVVMYTMNNHTCNVMGVCDN